MSSNIKGVAEIELRTDRFTKSAKKAETNLKDLGTKGKQSVDKIGRSANDTKQKLSVLGSTGKTSIDKIGQSASQAKQKVSVLGSQGQQSMTALGGAGARAGGQIATGMNQATVSVNQLNTATNQARVSSGTLLLGMAALGTSVGTTFTGMSNLNKAHLKQAKSIQKVAKVTVGLARANDLLSSTQLAVERFTLSISKAEREGKTDTDAYTIAKKNLALQQQKLTTAQDDYAVKLADIKIAENDALQVADDLQDTYINMTISIANTALMSGFLAKTMLPNLTKATIRNKLAVIANSRAMRFLGFDFQKARLIISATRLSMIGATGTVGLFSRSLIGLKGGIRAVFAALGPIGILIIAVGIGMEVWNNNIFGVQEALFGLWNFLKQLIPTLQILETIVKSVFPETKDGLETVTSELESGGIAALAFADSVDQVDKSLFEVPPALDAATQSMKTFGTEVQAVSKNLDEFKKKRELFSTSKVFADLSRSEQDEALFGKTGTFSRTGNITTLGFRGPTFTIGGRTFRSRITSTLGGTSSPFSGSSSFAGRTLSRSSRRKRAGGGGPNRHNKRQAQIAFQKLTGGDTARKILENLTGISLGLQVDQVVQRGKSGPKQYRFDLLRQNLAEANARVNLVEQINLISPHLNPSAKQSSAILRLILAEEERKIGFTVATLQISRSQAIALQTLGGGLTNVQIESLKGNQPRQQIQDFLTNESGAVDLANIFLWNDRQALLRTLV